MTESPDSSLDWREHRRLRAWALHQEGWSQNEIAREIGVTQSAVSRWFKQVREMGTLEGLRRHPAPGKQSRLNAEQRAQIPTLLLRGAEAFGFQGAHWTTKRIAQMFQQVFGVHYHPSHVSRLLQKHYPDWRNSPTAQKPE